MGHVYRARYVPRNLEVAVKMVPSEVTNETTLARFEREMEVLKELRHPHIVRTFGGVSESKQRFYAMELMPGGTMEDELQSKGRLTWERVIECALQMCSALEFLHGKGVVHRDVKPSNFLKSKDGRIKLSDFGLASVVAQQKITAEGKTAGTFLYMAPEQIRGEEVTPRTDLYALGCVLFELLTGKPPFLGETPAATLHKHCKATPPRVTEFALDCPLPLERIVARLLEKDPANRPASANEVAHELRMVSQTVQVMQPRQKSLASTINQQPVRARTTPDPDETQAVRTEAIVAARKPERRWRWTDLAWLVVAVALAGWGLSQRQRANENRRAHELWVRTAGSDSVEARRLAMTMLGELGDSEAAEALAERLRSDSDAQVRAAAAAALGQAGEAARGFVPLLHKLQKEDVSPDVRTACVAALKQLKSL